MGCPTSGTMCSTPRQVPEALSDMHAALATLEDQVKQLQDRLGPVLNLNVPKRDAGELDKFSGAPVAAELRGLTHTVAAISDIVASLLDSLQV